MAERGSEFVQSVTSRISDRCQKTSPLHCDGHIPVIEIKKSVLVLKKTPPKNSLSICTLFTSLLVPSNCYNRRPDVAAALFSLETLTLKGAFQAGSVNIHFQFLLSRTSSISTLPSNISVFHQVKKEKGCIMFCFLQSSSFNTRLTNCASRNPPAPDVLFLRRWGCGGGML